MSKYRAVKTFADGILFDSKKEARRYQDLILRERAGDITNLNLQVKFPIEVVGPGGKAKKVADYVADFTYYEVPSGEFVVEDVKGMKTPVYRLKKKLIEAQYGFAIHET